jgi:hypothetical protein
MRGAAHDDEFRDATGTCEAPAGHLLGEFLEDMRSWLDNRRIETVGFDILNGQCEVRFRTPEDARRFERRFD